MFERIKDVGHPNEEMLSVYRDHGVVRKNSRGDNFNKTAENRNIYQLVHPGWLVVNRMKAWQGSLGVSPLRGIVSGHYLCFRPIHDEDHRFLNYLLRSGVYATELHRLSRGVRPNQLEIDNDMLRTVPVLLPCGAEQRRIAAFLDVETERVDQLIAAKARILELLNERIDSQVMSFVGRSPLAGRIEIPVSPIKRQLEKLERPASEGEMITAFRDGQVTSRTARRRDGFTESWTDGAHVQVVKAGDVVVHGLDGFAGAIGDAEVDGVCSPVNHVCRPVAGDSTFLARMLRLLALCGYLGNFASSTRERAVDFRNWDLFGRIPIPQVPAEDQIRISAEIRALRPLQELVATTQALAKERQHSLITAVVTGEMEVP